MAFVVEDGTGLSTSTTYITLDFADTYAESFFSDTDYVSWADATDASKERYLNRATMYLDRTYDFKGEKGSTTQALEFPRNYLYDCLGNDVDSESVPTVIQQAVCEVAIKLLNNSGTSLDPTVDRKTVREKIDTIDITYSEGSASLARYPEIDNLLAKSCFVKNNRNSRANIKLIQG